MLKSGLNQEERATAKAILESQKLAAASEKQLPQQTVEVKQPIIS